MDGQAKAALAAAVAGGYVLGRTKKGRLALTGAALVMGRSLEPRQLLIEGVRRLRGVPAVAALGDQLRGEVYQAARDAAAAAVSRRVGGLTSGRQEDQAEDAPSGAEDLGPEEAAAEPDQDESAAEDEQDDERDGEESETGAGPAARDRAGRGTSDEGAAKRKAPPEARKAPARKPGAKKPPARKSAAEPAARKSGGAGKAGERGKQTSGGRSSTRTRSGR